MIRIFIYVIILLFFVGCKTEEDKTIFLGEFSGRWATTDWDYKFYSNQEFEFKSEGHFGNVESKGKYIRKNDSLFLTLVNSKLVEYGVVNPLYLIDGDTCIIDFRLRYDYCTTRDWSLERQIEYSDLKPEDFNIKSDLQIILKDALESEIINESMDTTKNLVIQKYYEFNEGFQHQLVKFGLPIIIKSKRAIKTENIEDYLRLEIKSNEDFLSLYISIYENAIPIGSIMNYYFYKNGKWKRDKRYKRYMK